MINPYMYSIQVVMETGNFNIIGNIDHVISELCNIEECVNSYNSSEHYKPDNCESYYRNTILNAEVEQQYKMYCSTLDDSKYANMYISLYGANQCQKIHSIEKKSLNCVDNDDFF